MKGTTAMTTTTKLTKAQLAEITSVWEDRPTHMDACDTEASVHVRYVARKATLDAIHRAGYAEHVYRDTSSVGGWKARLTDAGIALRASLCPVWIEENPHSVLAVRAAELNPDGTEK